MRKKCRWISCVLLISQIIFFLPACGSTSEFLIMELRYVSVQGNAVQEDGWNTKDYLCDYFHLQADEFMLSSLYSGTRHDTEEIPEIIRILKTATYVPCDIEPDDYEYVELLFFNNDRTIKARVIYAYRYSNRCVYAFYQDKCYRLENYTTLKTGLGKLTHVPQYYHLAEDGVNFFFYDRFFYDEYYDDKYEDRMIYDGFINTVPQKISTREDIQRLAIQEITDRMTQEMVWGSRYENRPDLTESQVERLYYDKYNEIWRTEIRVFYPIDAQDNHNNPGVPSRSSQCIHVYLNHEGCTQKIFDEWGTLAMKWFN